MEVHLLGEVLTSQGEVKAVFKVWTSTYYWLGSEKYKCKDWIMEAQFFYEQNLEVVDTLAEEMK